MNLSKVFVGMPRWNRPTHEANRDTILAGQDKCICVPSTATRVVVEMWGQGGGGAGANCCQWGIYGGQGGSYSNKVFTGVNSPAGMGTCISFCGCVCTCDCMTISPVGSATCGHCGQFSRLRNCNTVGAMASWIGCTTGGIGGVPLCDAANAWIDNYCRSNSYCQYNIRLCSLPFNSEYNTLCLDINKKSMFSLHMSLSASATSLGGSQLCCGAASCFCAATLTSATGQGSFNTNELILSIHQNNNALNNIFKCACCACFDNYRLGACGFTDLTDMSPLAKAGIFTCNRFAMIGVGGASYAGGAQQHYSLNDGGYIYQGAGGYFPGGGGKGSSTCGAVFCNGSIGGAGLIIISWN